MSLCCLIYGRSPAALYLLGSHCHGTAPIYHCRGPALERKPLPKDDPDPPIMVKFLNLESPDAVGRPMRLIDASLVVRVDVRKEFDPEVLLHRAWLNPENL